LSRCWTAFGPDGDDRTTDGLGDLNNDPDGSAGIDMGYGGEGTDIQPGRRRSSIQICVVSDAEA